MHKKSPVVFVVDDDASIRDSLGDLIRSAGLNVQTFASAQEVLTSLRWDAASCLVLDIQLPGLSGLDLQQELAQIDVQIPIIFITGHGDIPMTVRAMKAGASEFLTKPFRDEDLLNAIEQAINCGRQKKELIKEPVTIVQETQPPETLGAALASLAPNPWSGDQGLFYKEGEYWTIGCAGKLCRLKDTQGFAYLAQLLRSPGIAFHALDLVRGSATGAKAAGDAGATAPPGGQVREADLHVGNLGDAGEWLDTQAKSTYRRRLVELREELQAAKSLGRIAQAEAAEREIDALVAELARATGLNGRDRRAASAAERARQSVTRAIKSATSKIAEYQPALGRHLVRCIKTGAYCGYRPDPHERITWDFAARGGGSRRFFASRRLAPQQGNPSSRQRDPGRAGRLLAGVGSPEFLKINPAGKLPVRAIVQDQAALRGTAHCARLQGGVIGLSAIPTRNHTDLENQSITTLPFPPPSSSLHLFPTAGFSWTCPLCEMGSRIWHNANPD